MMRTAAVVVLLTGLNMLTGAAAQDMAEVFSLTPADAVAIVTLDAPPSSRTADPPATQHVTTQALLQIARHVGALLDVDETVRVWTDVASALVQLVRFPLTVALLDVRVTERADGGHELKRMQAVLIIDTQGRHEIVEQQIRHLLATYTNQERTKLRMRRDADWAGGGTGYELKDDRLPDWATLTWGPVGDVYVVALGEGAIERVFECVADSKRSLAGTDWLADAARACRATGIEFRLYADLDQLCDDQPSGFRARVRTWLHMLDLPDARRVYMTISREGRVVESSAFVREGRSIVLERSNPEAPESRRPGSDAPAPGRSPEAGSPVHLADGADRRIRMADHAYLKTWGYELIPDGATVFVVADVNFKRLPLALWEAYVASRSPSAADALRQALQRIEADGGASIRSDVLSRVGDRMVIHDFPVHALRLPVARTIYVPIEKEPAVVADKLDRFMHALAAATSKPGEPSPLHREADGLWYWHFGLQGPALKVCGDWIVISYSPYAVRENERHLKGWSRTAP